MDDSTYAEDLARLKKQEYETNEEAERLGLEFARDTEAFLREAALDTRRNMYSADHGSASGSLVVAADVSSADGISAEVPISAVHSTTPTDPSTRFNEPFTRFPSPTDIGNHQQSAGIFQSSSYDDDFAPTLTNLQSTVEVNPNPTKRINTIHPQSNILGDPNAMVQTRSTMKKTKFGECAFITYITNQKKGQSYRSATLFVCLFPISS